MLTLLVPKNVQEVYNEADGTFDTFSSDFYSLKLEHSLVSLSKWESFFKKPFLNNDKTGEEILWYIKAMCVEDDVPAEVFDRLTQQNIDDFNAYINDPMTATTFRTLPGAPSREIITAEIIYFWLVHYQIPFECQFWHLNRLLALVKVCNRKNAAEQKSSKKDTAAERQALNEQRRAEMNSKG